MGEKSHKIDLEVKKIHTQIKKSNLILKERMRDIQAELIDFNIGGQDEERDSNWF